MDMKKLIESIDQIEECGMDMPAAPMDKGNPVSMNVSLNASGKEHVADLLDMMKNAGMTDAAPVSAKTLAPRLDMERLRGIVDGPKMEDEEIEESADLKTELVKLFDQTADSLEQMGGFGDPDYNSCLALAMQGKVEECADDFFDAFSDRDGGELLSDDLYKEFVSELSAIVSKNENYANEPDEQYGAVDDVVNGGDDLHKSKKAYPKASGGDNAMALEQEILAALKSEYAKK